MFEMPPMLSLKDLVEKDSEGNSRIELIGKCIALLSSSFMENLDVNNPAVEQYISLILSETCKNMFEFLVTIPLNDEQVAKFKKQLMEQRLTKLLDETSIDITH